MRAGSSEGGQEEGVCVCRGWGGGRVEQRALTQYLMKEQRDEGEGRGGWGRRSGGQRLSQLKRWKE